MSWPLLFNCSQVNVTVMTFDGASTLVKVMAWCLQATGHYLSQGWPRSISTRQQAITWAKVTRIFIAKGSKPLSEPMLTQIYNAKGSKPSPETRLTQIYITKGSKPLPEPMLTSIHVTIWYHLATVSQQVLYGDCYGAYYWYLGQTWWHSITRSYPLEYNGQINSLVPGKIRQINSLFPGKQGRLNLWSLGKCSHILYMTYW